MKKDRVLTEAEKRRLALLERTTEDLTGQGYTRKDLTINMLSANIFAVVLLIVAFVVGYILYYVVNNDIGFTRTNPLVYLVTLVIAIVAHEFIHGSFWSMFTPNHFGDIEFGIMRSSCTPYCTCLVPLKKSHYIVGAVMPLLIMGVAPFIFGIVTAMPFMLFWGAVMISAAAGDIMIIAKILGYKAKSKDVVYIDHPTEAGLVVFER